MSNFCCYQIETLALMRAQAASILNSSQARIKDTLIHPFYGGNKLLKWHQSKFSPEIREKLLSQVCLETIVIL